jgi:hypothetical protein
MNSDSLKVDLVNTYAENLNKSLPSASNNPLKNNVLYITSDSKN